MENQYDLQTLSVVTKLLSNFIKFWWVFVSCGEYLKFENIKYIFFTVICEDFTMDNFERNKKLSCIKVSLNYFINNWFYPILQDQLRKSRSCIDHVIANKKSVTAFLSDNKITDHKGVQIHIQVNIDKVTEIKPTHLYNVKTFCRCSQKWNGLRF